MASKCYSELIQLSTFEERYEYLRLFGQVGEETFGFDRYLNQRFYRSREWRQVRDQVILRDNGCDLGVPEHKIYGRILIHHMNPIHVSDIDQATDYLLDPEYLITTTKLTHDAIHYGDASLLVTEPTVRLAGDTIPWR